MITENEYLAEQLLKKLKKIENEKLIKEFIENNQLLLEYYDKEYLININK